MRDVAYRVEVLRSGAAITTLQWTEDRPPQIYVDGSAEIHGSLKGSFWPNDVVDYLGDELRPVMIIDGEETPLGIYQTATARRTATSAGCFTEIEAYDRSWKISNCRTESVIHIPAEASYITEIKKILNSCGITLVIASPSDAVLQTDREDWDIGTSYLTIINELLAEINYNSVWFDADGICRIEPYQEPGAGNIDWRYGTTDMFPAEKHLGQNYSDEEDIFDAPNVFICICSNPDLDEPMTATAINDNPASRKSTFRRGMRIVEQSRVDNIASQEELQAYANKLRNESLLSTRTISFYTLPEPGHGVGDIIALTHEDIGGIYLETGWELVMSAGNLMTHSAKRTVTV